MSSKRPIGSAMLFSGGAEPIVKVEVQTYYALDSMHTGEPTLKISQFGEVIELSPETMQDILEWYLGSPRHERDTVGHPGY